MIGSHEDEAERVSVSMSTARLGLGGRVNAHGLGFVRLVDAQARAAPNVNVMMGICVCVQSVSM